MVYVLLSLTNPASAQSGGGGFGGDLPIVEDLCKSPGRYQVFQRDLNGLADVPIVLPESLKESSIVSVAVAHHVAIGNMGMGFGEFRKARFDDGKLIGIAAGGHYARVEIERKDKSRALIKTDSFYVGDLWVLAGQSNMQGVGRS